MAKNFEYKIHTFLGLNVVEEGLTLLKSGESPKMKNLRVTPSYTLALREGYECVAEFEEAPRGIKYFDEGVIAVFGRSVYRVRNGEKEKLGELESDGGEVNFLEYDKKLYFFDGVKIKVLKENEVRDIEPYVPLVAISTDHLGAGVSFEDVNLLSPKRRQSFTLADSNRTLPLAENNIDSVESVSVFGEPLLKNQYTVNLEKGVITLESDPVTDDPNAYEVVYSKSSAESERLIHSMRYAALWGGDNDTRIFLWGDSENPDVYRYSGVHDGISSMEYFPELYFNKTLSGDEVTALVRHYDRLLIFTKRDAYYSYVEAAVDAEGKKYLSFPIRTLSSTVGCAKAQCSAVAANNPITLFNSTLYKWVSTNIRDERNAQDIGMRIKRGLKDMGDKVSFFDRESTSELYIYSPDKIYVYNYALDLFYYYEGVNGVYFTQSPSGEVYFQNNDGKLCKFNESTFDIDKKIPFYWESTYDAVKGLETKNIHSIEFQLLPVSATSFDILWVSDTATSNARNLGLDYKIFDFHSLFFDSLSFKSSVTPVKLLKRVKLKRCRGFKLILCSNESSGDFHLTSLKVKGRISDAK